MADFSGKRVIVMGLGRFGGGIGVTQWLCAQGAKVHVTDLADEDHLQESLQALAGLLITKRLGGHDESDLEGGDLLVVSPAVDKAKSAFFQAAIRRGIPWTSEMNLFLSRCRGKIVGITGSVGKSTTTAMIGAILDRAARLPGWSHGRVWLGGNIGKSLLEDLPRIDGNDIVVLELSSFQLDDAANIAKSPHIAVVTNLKENHLDRHGTMQAYAAAKGNIYKFQGAEDVVVMPFGNGVELLPGGWESRRHVVRFGIDVESHEVLIESNSQGRSGGARIPAGARTAGARILSRTPPHRVPVQLSVPGLHNVQNAAAALAVARILGVPDDCAAAALKDFQGLAHRLEFVVQLDGVKYYNDSKATTPDAAMTSLRAFECGVVILVGGSDKGNSFAEFGRLLAQRAKTVICMGDTRDRIFADVEGAKGDASKPLLHKAERFADAIQLARQAASAGDVVLLSPGCASYDWFTNYEERGNTFKRLLNM